MINKTLCFLTQCFSSNGAIILAKKVDVVLSSRISKRIEYLIEKNSWSYEETGDKLNEFLDVKYPISNLRAWRNGTIPYGKSREALVKTFGVDWNFFVNPEMESEKANQKIQGISYSELLQLQAMADKTKNISVNLKRLMKQRKISNVELSKKLEVNVATIMSWKRGQSIPRINYQRKLASFFGIEVSELKENTLDRIQRIVANENVEDVFKTFMENFKYAASLSYLDLGAKGITQEKLEKYVGIFEDVKNIEK